MYVAKMGVFFEDSLLLCCALLTLRLALTMLILPSGFDSKSQKKTSLGGKTNKQQTVFWGQLAQQGKGQLSDDVGL